MIRAQSGNLRFATVLKLCQNCLETLIFGEGLRQFLLSKTTLERGAALIPVGKLPWLLGSAAFSPACQARRRRMLAIHEAWKAGLLRREHWLRNVVAGVIVGVLVYSIDGPLFFGAAETFERVLAHIHTDPRALVIRLRRVPFMDITGLQILEEVIQQLQRRQIRVVLCEANARVLSKLGKAGILQLIGSQHYHADFSTALSACVGEQAG
ncbi:sodium-independent anion transporter [Pseudomonas sp. UL073]|uniref:Sodium-independent anion transporter n=1 Tax=Zestomonas insulae TaxID=2809017 RepID=A0ABS2INC3_9GAMM|nr:sodium-independent anion transporter [Pseudomonas insulae]